LTLSFDGSSGHRETFVGELTSNELHLVHQFGCQFENEVQQQLICPAQSRRTLIGGKATPAATKGCECDGDLQASDSRCVPR
jgi:hypothetical protein